MKKTKKKRFTYTRPKNRKIMHHKVPFNLGLDALEYNLKYLWNPVDIIEDVELGFHIILHAEDSNTPYNFVNMVDIEGNTTCL